MIPKNPCYNCEKRCVGCAITCQEWIDHRKAKLEEYAAKRKAYNQNQAADEIVFSAIRRAKRRRNNGKW